MKYKAYYVTEESDKFTGRVTELDTADLPEGDVLIKVDFSSLNYKDALSSRGNKGVTRNFPHTPGIDAAGTVAESSSFFFKPGQEVIVTGYDLGMNTSGGFGQYIRVPAAWVVKRPENLSLKEAMIYGTAGFTAALSVYKLTVTGNVKPEDGDVLVTGARGGVGSHAVKFLAKAGYSVTAVTGIMEDPEKEFPEDEKFLFSIGAKNVIPMEDVDGDVKRPMLKTKWAGVIDTVGGNVLSTAIRETNYNGSVTTCGNAGGVDFYASVFPFIIRGVTLFGIDSVECPMDYRLETWKRMAEDWKPDDLHELADECSLDELDVLIDTMLKGNLKKRRVLNLNA